ncbi:uncharacterized protein [Nothobranchius furzeri]|uniref:Transcript variant X1 n=1 Tax=Nothobranchius furzeri TaxID=105023 RepID=A0A1A8AAQ9_NOTFU|nr:transcript variant X2 [Nothobranchius furzeri]KAF7221512.1 transcript variant X1 [Nothobranchius furzeri]
MDLVDICTSIAHNKKRVNKKNKNGHKLLQLRKTAVQPPAMQSQDKNGPKKIAEEWEQRVSSNYPPQESQQWRHKPNHGGSTLRFTCSQCKDTLEYVPKDLVRHFVDKHRGSPPVFSCHLCTFSTHEFSFLQVHLLSHKDTFSSCSMCNDNIQRTWPEFSAHLTMYHCPNGKYSCDLCQQFSTGDFRVFLEHIYGHNLNLETAEDVDQTLRCTYCSFKASEKRSSSKHAKADHVCKTGNLRSQTKQVHSITPKAVAIVPPKKTRLTRSSVRETCWLTQDCLTLPGTEFLDKYCHLSDPQTTLEETQQFLMQSVAVETNNKKWTKALKTVLSNVPQEVNLYQSENGIMTDSQDLAVLTVKNKIMVSPNVSAYPRRLKTKTFMGKKAVCPEASASDTPPDQIQPSFKDQTPSLQVENKPHNDVSTSMLNRENQELKMDKELEGSVSGEGVHISIKEKSSACRVLPRSKTQSRRWKRWSRFRKASKCGGKTLKLVLKKNLVKENLWVSQRDDEGKDVHQDASDPRWPVEEMVQPSHHNSGSTDDPPETRTLNLQLEPRSRSVKSFRPKDTLDGFQSWHQDVPGDPKKIPFLCSLETDPRSAFETQVEVLVQKSHNGPFSQDKERPAAVVQPAVTSHDELDLQDLCPEFSAQQKDQTIEAIEDGEVDLCSRVHSTVDKVIPQRSPPASGHRWQPVSRRQERILKLVAMNPSQAVKHPAGDQPVVVLNHPDADIPQVARIMEVVNRYSEVQKVLLSHSTLAALTALDRATAETDHPAQTQNPAGVQERFTLKLKFRRLTRKKYEIVGTSPSQESVSRFPCWFCGRVFTSQEVMMAHRQRHLMEWKRPGCEKSLTLDK